MPLSKKAKAFNRRQISKAKKSMGRKSKYVPKSVKRYVKKEIHRNIENKNFFVNNQVGFGSALESPDLNFAPILWYPGYHTLGLGVTDGARISNQVRIRKVILSYVIVPLPYDAATNNVPQPVHVQLFLGRLKQAKSVLPTSTDVATLFNAGSTSFGPSGGLIDLNSARSINTGFWDIKKTWEHKLGYAVDKNISTTYQEFANNDFKYNVVRRMDITKHIQKLVQFNDSSSQVQNGNLFFGYQAISATGNATGATQLLCRMNYSITITYEDA